MVELYLGLTLVLAGAEVQPAEADEAIPTVTVVARRQQPLNELANAVSVLTPSQQEPLATHANEVLDGAGGVWVSRGSGAEHLTAIRSPVLTGAGACGAFLYLEDGVPIRPAGFCNVNNLFELNLEQADRVEVLRGPGSALHGGNALHGSVNAVTQVSEQVGHRFGLMVGSDEYHRADFTLGYPQWRLDASLSSADSFRDDEFYDQQKVNLRWQTEVAGLSVTHGLAATNLNQETAGFIFGLDAYKDPQLRRANVNPEAFRDAYAVRLSSHIEGQQGQWSWRATPLLRHSRMDFLQHFLPGRPLEVNGQDSLGLLFSAHRPGTVAWTWGFDVDLADGFLREDQAAPINFGSPFLRATRPAGRHYDYQVDALSVALFAQAQYTLAPGWLLSAGLRGEWMRYDYDNRMLAGNTRDDGTPCGFGGCLFNRPVDRRDRFGDIAPKLSLQRIWSNGSSAYLRLARGFRPPQASELYRLQRQQSVADLDSETVDAVEVGYRWAGLAEGFSLAAYYMNKDNFIFRDATGFNVSDGRTRHRGLEFEGYKQLSQRWQVQGNMAYARHNYAFSRAAGGGEQISAGNQVDTAPEWLGRVLLQYQNGRHRAWLEWVHQGSYFLDAANAHEYGGHDLLHVNGSWALRQRWQVDWRISNVADHDYAERADFAFGNYRYFPGRGRGFTLALRYRAD